LVNLVGDGLAIVYLIVLVTFVLVEVKLFSLEGFSNAFLEESSNALVGASRFGSCVGRGS
jgi:hypothetical protein